MNNQDSNTNKYDQHSQFFFQNQSNDQINANIQQTINYNQPKPSIVNNKPKRELDYKKIGKLAGILLIIIIFIVAICIWIFGGSKKNNTGLLSYDASDVSYNCVLTEETESDIAYTYIDVLFNKTSKDDNEKYGIAAYGFFSKEYKYHLGDEEYYDFTTSIGCNDSGYCSGASIDLGESSFGDNTLIVRRDSAIDILYENLYYKGMNISRKEKKNFINQLKEQGYECK